MTQSRWRAPREDGAVLVSPSWADLPGLVEVNQQVLKRSPLQLDGMSLADLRQMAAQELGALSPAYGATLGLQVPEQAFTQRPVIATGHQPELFHPGVLVKNLAAARLAQQLGGTGFKLTVDSDVSKETGLKLPVTRDDHFDETLRFSAARPALPYEEWVCEDEAAFARLPQQARQVTSTWPWQPVLGKFWAIAVQASARTRVIPERWLVARHALEAEWGVVNHELPMSQVCRSDFFGLLFGTFLERRQELAAIHDDELGRYRREHKIRSRNHPVADLENTADRVELPFWAWQPGGTQRGRLFALRAPGGVELSVSLPGQEQRIAGTWPADVHQFRKHWPQLLATGWKIRPKALVTTMMMRLFVADLFLHGIGGAVYDELTERIFGRFFDTALPRFAVVTATLRLPWGEKPVGVEDERRVRQQLRTLEWNPDRLLPPAVDGPARHYVELKQQLIQGPDVGFSPKERHHQFEEVREHLHPYVAEVEERTQAALHETHRRHRRDEHRFSREHAWVLYPEEALLRLRDWFSRDA
jgi:hypothetical protein